MNSIEWLVLDVDDTLYLERDYVASGFAVVSIAARDSLGLMDFGMLCQHLFDEGRRGDVFNEALRQCGVDATPDAVAPLVNVYREHAPTITLCPDALGVLTQRPAHIGVVLLTGGDPGVQQRKIAALELEQFADHIVLSGSRGPDFDKPHPWSWELVQDITACTGERILYVGDNPVKDLPPSLALGWSFVRLRRPKSLHENVDTPHGIPEVLDLSSVTALTAAAH